MNMKNLVIGIAILILTISVVVYGVSLIYDSPEYSDYCSNNLKPALDLNDTQVCPAVCVEMWEIKGTECVYNDCGSGCGPNGVTSFETKQQCEAALTGNCYESYEKAREDYSKNLFLITLPLGIIIIFVGALVFGLETVGAGLMGGGVGVILWGIGSFWRYAGESIKFILSLIGLIVIIWFAYYFNKDKSKKKQSK